MYVQMLGHAVQKLRSGGDEDLVRDALTTPEMNLNLPLDHFIPRSFIRDERLRLQAYRELAASEDEGQLDGLLRSLRDRYGAPPAQLDNLAFSLRVKLRGQRMGLRSVVAEGTEMVISVDPQKSLDVEELVRRFGGRLRVTPNRLKLRRRGEDWQADLIELLTAMEELYEDGRISAGV
jgi:transcription-repair coupling factor (superfamily II helicase)